ncbi:hypothetical protein RHS03_09529, partial [Rhizoctonia solani]
MVDFDPKYLAPGPVSDHHLHGDLKKYLYVTDPHVANHRMRFKLVKMMLGAIIVDTMPMAAGDEEVAKICYFGSSAIECACYAHPENRPAGTPQWYSPELWVSTKEDDDDTERSRTQQSDIWAFGCVTLEVQMGMMPWDPFHKGSQHGTMSRQQRAGTGPPATAEGLELGEHPIKQRHEVIRRSEAEPYWAWESRRFGDHAVANINHIRSTDELANALIVLSSRAPSLSPRLPSAGGPPGPLPMYAFTHIWAGIESERPRAHSRSQGPGVEGEAESGVEAYGTSRVTRQSLVFGNNNTILVNQGSDPPKVCMMILTSPQRHTTMYSRTTATRAFTCRRLFSTAKSTIVKRSVPAITQSSGSLFTTLHSASHLPVLRYIGRSQLRHYTASTGVEEDPERKGLYYHPVGDNIFALSFLKEKPVNKSSATVIGLVKGGEESNSFQENQAFVDLLHETVKAALIEGADRDLGNDAVQRKEGWLHVHDYRNFPELGRVGDPDDILGSVLVQDGKIKGETYERMPAYRTCTTDGPVKLSPSLHERLLKSLKEAYQKESKA